MGTRKQPGIQNKHAKIYCRKWIWKRVILGYILEEANLKDILSLVKVKNTKPRVGPIFFAARPKVGLMLTLPKSWPHSKFVRYKSNRNWRSSDFARSRRVSSDSVLIFSSFLWLLTIDSFNLSVKSKLMLHRKKWQTRAFLELLKRGVFEERNLTDL